MPASCSVSSNTYAGFTRSVDLSAAHDNCKRFVSAGSYFVWACVWWLQGAACGILPQEHTGQFRRSLWLNVAGDAWCAAGVGRSWSMWRRSCCRKVDASNLRWLVYGAHRGPAGAHHRRALPRMNASPPCRRCVCRVGLVAGRRSTSPPRGT